MRTSIIYDESPTSFFSWVNSSLLNDNAIQVVTDQVSNPTWTWSISEAIYKLILNNLEGLYHFAGDDILSRYDFALKIAKIYNYNLDKITPIETKKLKQLAKRPLSSVLNNDKIKNHIDIEHPSMDSVIKRIKENEPRTCDIDIIDYNGKVLDFTYKSLIFKVPHEKLIYRNFVLFPLREIAPKWVHPKTKDSIDELIKKLPNQEKKSILKIAKS